jgi:hypothetical protein
VGAANGELEVVQEHFQFCQLPPVGEICQFCQASKWKFETGNCCCRNGQVVLAPLHDPPQEFKHLFETPLLLVKVRSYDSIFTLHLHLRPCLHRVRKMPGLMSNWQTLEKAYTRSVYKEE